jgi:hypothetical protein
MGRLGSLLSGVLRTGDPEATGAAQVSQAMEPVVGPYLQNVVTGKIAAQGLEQRSGGYRFDPSLTSQQNADTISVRQYGIWFSDQVTRNLPALRGHHRLWSL